MTNNMDEFDQDGLDPSEAPLSGNSPKKNLAEAWRSQPIFKLFVIMGVVGVAIAGALGVFSGSKEVNTSNLVNPPDINEAPGSKASPYFNEQSKQASQQRAEIALEKGGSAMPTPVGQNAELGDLNAEKSNNQLLEFRAEAERLKQELRQEQKQSVQVLQQQVQQQQVQRTHEQEDNTLAQAMQRQMQQLMDSWTPRSIKVVAGDSLKEYKDEQAAAKAAAASFSSKEVQSASASTALETSKASLKKNETILAAGTVNYAQLLTEANSDVPSAILVQILSGPLAGARAVGHFQVTNDYLVLEFNLATLKGKDYQINAIALDPDTTLAGMATEVDHRYFSRVLLPAAASFLSTFGSSMGSTDTTTSVSDGTVVTDSAKKSSEDAIYAGIGQMGQTMGQFFMNQANQTKTLVRVAVGTPVGLFFLSSVKENQETADNSLLSQTASGKGLAAAQAALLSGYNNGQGYVNGATSQQISNPYLTSGVNQGQTGTVTVLTPGQSSSSGYTISRY